MYFQFVSVMVYWGKCQFNKHGLDVFLLNVDAQGICCKLSAERKYLDCYCEWTADFVHNVGLFSLQYTNRSKTGIYTKDEFVIQSLILCIKFRLSK